MVFNLEVGGREPLMPSVPLNREYCPRGHKYTPENTYLQKPHPSSGAISEGKVCRQCRKIKDQGRRGVFDRPVDWKPKTGQYLHKRKHADDEIRRKHNWSQYKERQRNFINSLKAKGCSICGYSKCSGALEFHHVNGSNKEGGITAMARKNMMTVELKEEIKKCILVCSNCHREIHYGVHEETKCG